VTGTSPSDADVFAHFHDVRIDHDNIAHYRGLMEGQLLINRCSECGTWIYPHRPLCPHCLSWKVAATQVSGAGRLYMWTVIHQSRSPDNPLFEPVTAAAVELVEQKGLRYLSRIVNCAPDGLVHDMALRLTWIEENGRRWPAFEPATASEPAAHG
jgi:uncharacterized OB-fold protein